MISPETLRRYGFFAGLDHNHILVLARNASEQHHDTGDVFFLEDDELNAFYLVRKGQVGITLSLPDAGEAHPLSETLVGAYPTREDVITVVREGEVFGWSGLIAPHTAAANARALTPCEVIAISRKPLQAHFETDWQLGYLMVQKAAVVVRNRLRDLRLEVASLQEPADAQAAPL